MEKISFEELTGRDNKELVTYQEYRIHKDMLDALSRMQLRANQEIGVNIEMISSYRDFDRQLLIWNEKTQGKRKVLDDEGNEIDPQGVEANELVEAILRFSALPGASRHHWGTDIDVFDAMVMNKNKVQLTHEESITQFKGMHEWLDRHMSEFGFFRPYELDLGGVFVEKWHLSYAPLSQAYFEAYTIEVFQQNIEESEILLKEIILRDLEFYFEKYFKNINLP